LILTCQTYYCPKAGHDRRSRTLPQAIAVALNAAVKVADATGKSPGLTVKLSSRVGVSKSADGVGNAVGGWCWNGVQRCEL
jgi:hypothetical protein